MENEGNCIGMHEVGRFWMILMIPGEVWAESQLFGLDLMKNQFLCRLRHAVRPFHWRAPRIGAGRHGEDPALDLGVW